MSVIKRLYAARFGESGVAVGREAPVIKPQTNGAIARCHRGAGCADMPGFAHRASGIVHRARSLIDLPPDARKSASAAQKSPGQVWFDDRGLKFPPCLECHRIRAGPGSDESVCQCRGSLQLAGYNDMTIVRYRGRNVTT